VELQNINRRRSVGELREAVIADQDAENALPLSPLLVQRRDRRRVRRSQVSVAYQAAHTRVRDAALSTENLPTQRYFTFWFFGGYWVRQTQAVTC
jgi:hypothetical protein